VIVRLYGPTEPFFDQSWKPGDMEQMAKVPADTRCVDGGDKGTRGLPLRVLAA
jgi:hypothetical protein